MGGPRATDRFAAVSAAFVAGLAATARLPEVAAHFLDALASSMEVAVKVRFFYPLAQPPAQSLRCVQDIRTLVLVAHLSIESSLRWEAQHSKSGVAGLHQASPD